MDRELYWTFLSIFSKRNIFFTLQNNIFLISICSFEGVQHFWLVLAIFYSKLRSATNQQLFLRHWKRYRSSNHIAPLFKLTIKTPKRSHWHHYDFFIINIFHNFFCYSISIATLNRSLLARNDSLNCYIVLLISVFWSVSYH